MWLSEMKFVITMIQANTVLKIYEVLAAQKRNLLTARARKKKHSAHMLANARKDHSIPLKRERGHNAKYINAKFTFLHACC